MKKELIKKEIEKIKEKIIQKYRPEKIIVFGSFVWGKWSKDSDVDFLIVKNTKKRKLDRIYQVYRILTGRRIPVDILVYTPEEIKKRLKLKDFFIEEVLQKGKTIYERRK
jgi:predicted nucleotidyltransferase